jgi:branched-chain amino acid transport system permease protein
MKPRRVRDLRVDIWGVLVLLPLLLIPLLTADPLFFSLGNQIAIAICAALSVYTMEKMNLLAFTIPSFMAIGGYTTALLALKGITSLPVLMAAAVAVPMIAAVPVGIIVLRLKGVYFIFFTFILNEAMQVAIFETPDLTGGSNGITGFPVATLLGRGLGAPNVTVFVTVACAVAAGLLTLAVTQRYRAEFSAIQENESLAQSLGVAVWKYRTIGFVVSSGTAGLGGLALAEMLMTVHPSSFASFSAINYVAYAFVGGRGTVLGPVIGAILLVSMSNYFSSQGELSGALFGLLLIVVVMGAPTGVVGEIRQRLERNRLRLEQKLVTRMRVTK